MREKTRWLWVSTDTFMGCIDINNDGIIISVPPMFQNFLGQIKHNFIKYINSLPNATIQEKAL